LLQLQDENTSMVVKNSTISKLQSLFEGTINWVQCLQPYTLLYHRYMPGMITC